MHLKMRQANLIKEALANDKTSSNSELIEYFVNVVGISEKMAKEYVCSRLVHQNHIAFKTQKEPT